MAIAMLTATLALADPTAGAGCPTETKVAVESTNAAYVAGTKWDIRDAKAKGLFGTGGFKTVFVHLANHPLAGLNYRKAPLQEGQGVVLLEIAQEGGVVKVGRYPAGKGAARATPSVIMPGGRKVQLDQATTQGEIEVLAITDKQICGKFSLKDARTSVSGEFVATF